MKLEKLLAENMLRFGVKNLNNTDVHQILTIMEQAAETNAEDPTVTAMPAYKPVMEWWNKNASKNSIAKRSLDYWTGSQSKGNVASKVKATNNLLKHLITLSKNTNLGLDAQKVADLIKFLQENTSKNVYYNSQSVGGNNAAFYLVRILAGLKSESDPLKSLSGSNGKGYITAFNKLDIARIKAELEKSQFVFANPTVEDKIALLNYFTEQATAKIARRDKAVADNPLQRMVKWDLSKAIKEATAISIAPGIGEIKTIEAETPPPSETEQYTFSYPNTDDITGLQNFYLSDNVTAVTPENEAAFKDALQNLLTQIPAGQKIIEVHIKAGSSTSRVPTTFGSTDGKYTSAGNEKLVDARLQAIQEALSRVVDTTVPKGEWKLITDNPQRTPNIGPPWTKDDRDTTYPLSKRRKTLPNGAPNPNYDQTVVDGYEAKFGKYKGSFGQISIVTETGRLIPYDTQPGKQVTAQWAGKISWTSGGTGNGKPKTLRGSNKGEKAWTGQGTLDCPIWK